MDNFEFLGGCVGGLVGGLELFIFVISMSTLISLPIFSSIGHVILELQSLETGLRVGC